MCTLSSDFGQLQVVEFANGARASLDLCMFAEDEQTEQAMFRKVAFGSLGSGPEVLRYRKHASRSSTCCQNQVSVTHRHMPVFDVLMC